MFSFKKTCESCGNPFFVTKPSRLRQKYCKRSCVHKAVCMTELPGTLLKVSSRTATKILQRLGVGCSRCGWNETTCDLHHIRGRKIENADDHSNLTLLCPNCHRLVHAGKIDVGTLISFDVYVGDRWKQFYYA